MPCCGERASQPRRMPRTKVELRADMPADVPWANSPNRPRRGADSRPSLYSPCGGCQPCYFTIPAPHLSMRYHVLLHCPALVHRCLRMPAVAHAAKANNNNNNNIARVLLTQAGAASASSKGPPAPSLWPIPPHRALLGLAGWQTLTIPGQPSWGQLVGQVGGGGTPHPGRAGRRSKARTTQRATFSAWRTSRGACPAGAVTLLGPVPNGERLAGTSAAPSPPCRISRRCTARPRGSR